LESRVIKKATSCKAANLVLAFAMLKLYSARLIIALFETVAEKPSQNRSKKRFFLQFAAYASMNIKGK
jgi:hypothetical protein